jgi:hypothetical protein
VRRQTVCGSAHSAAMPSPAPPAAGEKRRRGWVGPGDGPRFRRPATTHRRGASGIGPTGTLCAPSAGVDGGELEAVDVDEATIGDAQLRDH